MGVSQWVHFNFVRAKHDRSKSLVVTNKLSAVMLRPYPCICKRAYLGEWKIMIPIKEAQKQLQQLIDSVSQFLQPVLIHSINVYFSMTVKAMAVKAIIYSLPKIKI